MSKYNLIRYIPTGDFPMFDYDSGLLSIKLRQSIKYVKNIKQNGAAVNVTINNIDDGDWSAETVLISDDADFDFIFNKVEYYLNNLSKLPTVSEFLLELSIAGETMFTSLHKL
jgi:hypothetical protein